MREPSTVALSDRRSIPQLGFGVFRILPGGATQRAVAAALTAGYRHVDTAAACGNEADVGQAIRASGLPPGSVWVTTKLANRDQGAATARRAFEASLHRLGLDAVDLYLLHWPHERRLESWRVLPSNSTTRVSPGRSASRTSWSGISTSCSRTRPCLRR